MARLNVEMPEELLDEFRARADRLGRSVSDVVRELTVGWVRQERRAEAELLSLDEQREKRRAE
jgi:plasmid stability protein